MSRGSFYGGEVKQSELANDAGVNAGLAAASAAAAAASASAASTANSEVDSKVAQVESYVTNVYLGPKSSDPTVDNAGNALTTGTWYFNTNTNLSMIYNGTEFQVVLASTTNLMPLGGGAFTGPVTTNSTFDGRDVATDGTKLDGIEANATADQTGAQIKTAYEGESDTNAFTDAEKTKLAGIAAGSTANQTAAEIKASYESNADTNAYDDAAVTKLAGIEAGADVTDLANVSAIIATTVTIESESNGTPSGGNSGDVVYQY